MISAKVGLREPALASARRFLLPVARFMLRHGVTFKDFVSASKEAYIKAAADPQLHTGKVSASRISEITGIPRRACGKVIRAALQRRDSAEPGAAIREADATIGDCRSADYMSLEATDASIVRRFGEQIFNLAATIDYNCANQRTGSHRFEASATCLRFDPRLLRVCRQVVAESATKYLEEMDSWFTAHELDAGQPTMSVGVGLYFFEDSSRHGDEQAEMSNNLMPLDEGR